jgi:NAD(P)-dependent dehydrogenase (short-subunit alcohol dehydrogenase family)
MLHLHANQPDGVKTMSIETKTLNGSPNGHPAGPLAGKAALVTGGSRSIGAAIARKLAADGAAVAITYSASPDKAKQVVAEIEAAGGRAIAIEADAGEPEAVRAAVAETVETLGGIDILVNNAGLGLGGPIEEIPFGTYERMILRGYRNSSRSPRRSAVAMI